MKWLVLLFLVAECLHCAVTAKILALCAVASPSHSLWCYKYMAALAERGHEITVFGVDKPKINIPNLKTFITENVYSNIFFDDVVDTITEDNESKISFFYNGYKIWSEMSSKLILHSDALKELIKHYSNGTKPFDLIIHDNGNVDALLGLVPLFGNPPLVLATTYGSPQWTTFRAGNIFNPAFVPSMISSFEHQMSFYERFVNTVQYVFLEWMTTFIYEPFQDQLMREVFGNHLPYITDIVKQSNIIIVNYHFAMHGPRPMLPGVVGIAGLHISEPQPLPQDIKKFMDEAKDGVVLFSFGTNIKSNWFPKDFESTVVKAFAQLPQRVFWKWDKILPDIPSNIKMSKWLPQGDMLVHPNMRLFVSHCGLLSTQEVIYRKIPILALPVFMDQLDNAAMLVRKNLTIQLNVFNMTTEQLRDGIKEILSNPMYKNNIAKMGELMGDMPQTSKQQAVFWTEYAIRHQGAVHLHSVAADMSWYQLLLLDILGFVIVMLFIVFWVIKICLSSALKRMNILKSKTKTD